MARLELLSVPVEPQCPGFQVVQAMLEHLSPRRSERLTLGGKQTVGCSCWGHVGEFHIGGYRVQARFLPDYVFLI